MSESQNGIFTQALNEKWYGNDNAAANHILNGKGMPDPPQWSSPTYDAGTPGAAVAN